MIDKMTDLEIVEKYHNCFEQLDENKKCATCVHRKDQVACDDCYDIVLGLPINPSNWKGEK